MVADALTAGMLLIDGEPVCFSFGINAAGTRHSIATSYDERFARHSVGYLTGCRTYAEAVLAGFDVLNLGTGDCGAKSSMGAAPGPEMVDCLFVRSRVLAALPQAHLGMERRQAVAPGACVGYLLPMTFLLLALPMLPAAAAAEGIAGDWLVEDRTP